MAIICNNAYKFSLSEKISESLFLNIEYPIKVKFTLESDKWFSFSIKILGEECIFWVYNNSLQRGEIKSIVRESLVSSKINGHSYIRKEVKIHKDDIVIDAGGCEGIFTRYALLCGASKVYIFEPFEEFAIGLERTFKKEIKEKRVEVVRMALSDKSKEVSFFIDEDMKCGNKIDSGRENANNNKVKCISLDEFVDSSGISKVDHIKMDIEGEEINAICGCKKVIELQSPNLLIAIYHNYINGIRLYADIKKINQEYNMLLAGCWKTEKPARPYMLIGYK